MAFTDPKTWNTGDVLTAADLNTYIRDNERAEAGRVVARADLTSGTSGVSAETVQTTTSSFTAVTGRLYEVRATGIMTKSANTDTFVLRLRDGSTVAGTQLKSWQGQDSVNASINISFEFTWVGSLSAGTHTIVLTIARLTGTGNGAMVAGASDPVQIVVKDVGPG